MNNLPYSQKLANNKWHKVRDAVRIRDEYTCQKCGDTEHKQDVHHIQYLKGKEPWDSPMEDLITLCERCHRGEHKPDAPKLEVLEQTRLELLDKINSSKSSGAINTWRQAVSMIESQAMEFYGINLNTTLNHTQTNAEKITT